MQTRDRLERQRREALDRLNALTTEFDRLVAASDGDNADDEHDPEGSTIAFERSQLDALIQQDRTRLIELDAADERLARGTYGRCEQCSDDIPAERLIARPIARTCIRCASDRSAGAR